MPAEASKKWKDILRETTAYGTIDRSNVKGRSRREHIDQVVEDLGCFNFI